MDNTVDAAVLATASATHSRRHGLRYSSALAPAACGTCFETRRAVTPASALTACSIWLATAHRGVLSCATLGACPPPSLPRVTRTTGGTRTTGSDADGQSNADGPSDACECGRTCSNGRGRGEGCSGAQAIVLVYFVSAVYFVGADPLAGVSALEVRAVRAFRWRAAATHVWLAVAHRPGASSWDGDGADVCHAFRFRFDAVEIARLFFLFCVMVAGRRFHKLQELRKGQKESGACRERRRRSDLLVSVKCIRRPIGMRDLVSMPVSSKPTVTLAGTVAESRRRGAAAGPG